MTLAREASRVVGGLLALGGVRVEKALNPLRPADFTLMVQELADELRKATAGDEAAAVRRALGALDVDWPRASEEVKAAAVDAARRAIAATLPARKLPVLEATFKTASTRMVGETKKRVTETYKLSANPSLDKTDQNAIDFAAASSAAFVRDQYGRRATALTAQVARAVADGVAAGHDRTTIGAKVEAIMEAGGARRSRSYADLVAGVHLVRARSYASLTSYARNGLAGYRFEAVLDERTSKVCRFLHGRVFPVAPALQKLTAGDAAGDPATETPWVGSARDPETGEEFLYYKDRAGVRQPIATVQRSGAGRVDDTGAYTSRLSDDALSRAGVTTPPCHGHCRSTLVPDFSVVAPLDDGPAAGGEPAAAPVGPAPGGQAPAPGQNGTAPAPGQAAPGYAPGAPLPRPAQPAATRPAGSTAWEARTEAFATALQGAQDETGAIKGPEFRGALRGVLAEQGLVSQDEARRLRGRNQYAVKSDAALEGASAYHDWNGKVVMAASVDENLKTFVRTMKIQSVSLRARYQSMSRKVLESAVIATHEELHGHSRMTEDSYDGAAGGLEEVGTELLARRSMRRMFGLKRVPGSHPFSPPLPGPTPAGQPARFYQVNDGAYRDEMTSFLGIAHKHLGGDPATVAERCEEAFLRLRSKRDAPPFNTPAEHINAFVAELNLPADKARALAAEITASKEMGAP